MLSIRTIIVRTRDTVMNEAIKVELKYRKNITNQKHEILFQFLYLVFSISRLILTMFSYFVS